MDSTHEVRKQVDRDRLQRDGQSCPSSDLLAALLAGQLEASESAMLHRHVDLCDDCLDLLAALASSSAETDSSSEARVGSRSALMEGADWTAGTVLIGRFVIGRRLGRGATGVVYQADDLLLGHAVALKLLRQPSAQMLWRFKREFRLCRWLRRAQLVKVYDLFTDGNNWWFTMELVDGMDLLSWLENTAPDKSPNQFRQTFAQIAASLQAVHQAGLVHRDVKSQNVRVTPSGRVVLIDLGLTTEVGDSSGDVVGTPVYMSPEQSVGGRARPASDWYSFGVLLRTALDSLYGNSGSPPQDLRDLAQDLTLPNPEQRPSGPQIIGRLGYDLPGIYRDERVSLDGPLQSALETLEAALRQSASGPAVVTALQGSVPRVASLLHAFSHRALRMTPTVSFLEIGGVAGEHIPLATLDAIVDQLIGLLRSWPEEELKNLFPAALAALSEVFPSLCHLGPLRTSTRAQLQAPSIVAATQLPALFSRLFQRLVTRGPLILVLHETESLDTESCKILEDVLSGPESPSILLLLTGRVEQSPWAQGRRWNCVQTVHCDSTLSATPSSLGTAVEPPLTLALAVASSEPWTQSTLRSLRQELLHAGLGTDRIRDGILISTLNRSSSSEVLDLLRPTLQFAEGLARRGFRVALASDVERENAQTLGYQILRHAGADQHANVRIMSGLLLDTRTAALCLHGSDAERLLLGRPTAFYGRGTDLESIRHHLRRCTAQSEAGGWIVSGEPGLGKTRLCQECLLTEPSVPHQRFSAECDPRSPGDTFGLIRQTLRSLCMQKTSLEKEAEPLGPKARFHTRIARTVPADHVERVVEFLAEVCGISGFDSPRLRAARQDTGLMQHQVRRAFFDFLRAECERLPVVWFIDNLHWVDAASMRLIREALTELQLLPLFLLGTARPQILQRFSWLGDDPQIRTVPLSSLDDSACRRIVQDAFGTTVSEKRVESLVERSGGNPLFLEELIRATSLGQSDICPDSVRLLLHGRLTQLLPGEVDVLGAAGVIGESFSASQLSSVLHAEPSQTLVALEKLVRSEWLAPAQPDAVSAGWFRFGHSLLRDVAYERLNTEQRRQYHLDFGRFLIAQADLEPFRAAEHFEQGGDRRRAAYFYGLAAERALRAGEHAVAEDLAQRGIECDEPGIEQRLQIVWMEAHGWRRDLGRSQRYLRATLGSAPPGSEMWLRSQVLRQLLALNAIEPEQLLLAHREMGSCSPAEASASVYGYAFGGGTFMMMLSGQTDLVRSSIDHLTAVLEPFAKSNPVVAAWIETCQSFWLGFCQDAPWAALTLARGAVFKFASVGDELNASIPKTLVAIHSWALGDVTTAERLFGELVESKKTTGGFRDMQPGLLAVTLVEQGKLDLALGLINRYLHRTTTQDHAFREGWVRWGLAEYHLVTGNLQSAEQEARRSIEQLVPMFQQQLPVMALHSEILLKQGHVQESLEQARKTLASYHRLSALGYRGARAERVLAEALWTGGCREEAASILQAARDRIHANATRISDPEVRQQYLTAVPEHQRIESLFRLVCGEVPITS